MTRDEMIEKAARKYDPDAWKPANKWIKPQMETRQHEARCLAEVVLTAVIPGIMAGTHVELPIEATTKMDLRRAT